MVGGFRKGEKRAPEKKYVLKGKPDRLTGKTEVLGSEKVTGNRKDQKGKGGQERGEG